ncbi:hypothetical protein ZEAMMB73_Zm00001d016080 [Zea mays]|uniref:Uncharacterized protein n=1 Tax=Zea mays TaxID=4577 RepID=A0A1D6H5D9_MAIZE|nr:hypothetical protein ZEAMMB73_Zm00001d016080 [Zea mays]
MLVLFRCKSYNFRLQSHPLQYFLLNLYLLLMCHSAFFKIQKNIPYFIRGKTTTFIIHRIFLVLSLTKKYKVCPHKCKLVS